MGDGISSEEIALFNQLMMLAAEKPGGFDTMKRSDGISSEEIALFNQLMMLAAEKPGGFDTMKRSDGISSEEMEFYRQLMALAAEKRGVDPMKRSDGISSEEEEANRETEGTVLERGKKVAEIKTRIAGNEADNLLMGMTPREYLLWERDQKFSTQAEKREKDGSLEQVKR